MRKRSKKQKSEMEETTAAGIVAAATQDIELTAEQIADATKRVAHAAAVALGKLGGLKGGQAKAAKPPSKKPAQIAKKAAGARRSRSAGKPIKR
jgi:hypothetical protein